VNDAPTQELPPRPRPRQHPLLGALLFLLAWSLAMVALGMLIGYAWWGKG
jgi:hypothetical protein